MVYNIYELRDGFMILSRDLIPYKLPYDFQHGNPSLLAEAYSLTDALQFVVQRSENRPYFFVQIYKE